MNTDSRESIVDIGAQIDALLSKLMQNEHLNLAQINVALYKAQRYNNQVRIYQDTPYTSDQGKTFKEALQKSEKTLKAREIAAQKPKFIDDALERRINELFSPSNQVYSKEEILTDAILAEILNKYPDVKPTEVLTRLKNLKRVVQLTSGNLLILPEGVLRK